MLYLDLVFREEAGNFRLSNVWRILSRPSIKEDRGGISQNETTCKAIGNLSCNRL